MSVSLLMSGLMFFHIGNNYVRLFRIGIWSNKESKFDVETRRLKYRMLEIESEGSEKLSNAYVDISMVGTKLQWTVPILLFLFKRCSIPFKGPYGPVRFPFKCSPSQRDTKTHPHQRIEWNGQGKTRQDKARQGNRQRARLTTGDGWLATSNCRPTTGDL